MTLSLPGLAGGWGRFWSAETSPHWVGPTPPRATTLDGSTRTARWTSRFSIAAPRELRITSASSLALQADGKILVGGNFTTLGGGQTPHQPPRPAQPGRHPGLHLQSWSERLGQFTGPCRQMGKNPVGGILHDAGRETPRAITLAGSTRTERWMPRSIRAPNSYRLYRWRCSPTGRSWSAADSRRWAAGRDLPRRATGSAGSTPMARSTPSFNPGANGDVVRPGSCSPTGRSWPAAPSRRSAAGPARRHATGSGGSPIPTAAIQRLERGRALAASRDPDPAVNAALTWTLDGAWPDVQRVTFDWSSGWRVLHCMRATARASRTTGG